MFPHSRSGAIGVIADISNPVGCPRGRMQTVGDRRFEITPYDIAVGASDEGVALALKGLKDINHVLQTMVVVGVVQFYIGNDANGGREFR